MFRFATGKLSRAYDESLEAVNELQRSESGTQLGQVLCSLVGASTDCCAAQARAQECLGLFCSIFRLSDITLAA